jgi:DNA-directed RNA polymerase specialized sigma24 family protein
MRRTPPPSPKNKKHFVTRKETSGLRNVVQLLVVEIVEAVQVAVYVPPTTILVAATAFTAGVIVRHALVNRLVAALGGAHMMTSTAETSNFDSTLPGFLSGDPIATEQFVEAARRYLQKIANKLAPGLPIDIREEIVSQTFLNLLGAPGKKFDPRRGSAKAFLKGLLLNAVRQVRAAYCPPGHPTRIRKYPGKRNDAVLYLPPVISLDADNFVVPVDAKGPARIEAECDARMILDSAPPLVAAALRLVHFYGDTHKEAADTLGVPVSLLKAEFSNFQRQFRLAA